MYRTKHAWQYGWVGIFLVIMAVALAGASTQFFINGINSDWLYLFDTANTIFQNKTIAGQNFPAVPYYFPDMLIAIVLGRITQNLTIIHFLYSLLFLMAYFYVVYLLFSRAIQNKQLVVLGAFIAFFTFFLLPPPAYLFLRDWPGSHLSAVLLSLFFFQYYCKHLGKPFTRWEAGVAFIIFYLCYISDNLIFAQFLFPISVIIAIDLFLKKANKKFAFTVFGIFLLTILLSAKTADIFSHYFGASFSMNVSLYRLRKLEELSHTLGIVAQLFVTQIRAHSPFFTVLGVFNAVNLILNTLFYCKKRNSRSNSSNLDSITRIIGFLYLAQISNVVLAILARKLDEVTGFRYIDTLYIFPYIQFAFLLILLWEMKWHVRWLFGMTALLFLGSVTSFIYYNGALIKQFRFAPPYNTTVHCMDELQQRYALKNGLADYWHMRPVRMLSKQQLGMTQIDEQLNFKNTVDNLSYFYKDVATKTRFNYQFIIVNNLPKAKIQSEMGVPDHVEFCPEEVWIYTNKASLIRLNKVNFK